MSFEHLGEPSRNGSRHPKAALDPKHYHSHNKEVNLLVIGVPGVGKTALTVRFLTKRFIGDYDSKVEMLYSSTLTLEGKHVNVHILDTLGQKSEDDLKTDHVMWADAILVVYAINDKNSFDAVKHFVDRVHAMKGQEQFPLAIVANKSDLIHRKQVSDIDASRTCAEYCCSFFETSASDSHSSVAEAFVCVSRQARLVQKKKEKLTRFMSNPAVAAKLQIQQSLKHLAERTWRARTSTL